MKRLLTLAAIGLSLFLAGCIETAPKAVSKPAEPPMATAAQTPQKSIIEMEYELRGKEIDLQTTQAMTLIKFAAESDSDFAKGMVAGMFGGKSLVGASSATGGGSFMQAVMKERQRQDAIELERERIAAENSLWNKGMDVLHLLFGDRRDKRYVNLQRFGMELNAEQDRYRLDTYFRTQQAGYDFAGKVVDKGPYTLPAGSHPVSPVTSD